MGLRIENNRVVWTTVTQIHPILTVVPALAIAVLAYLVARLGDVLDGKPEASRNA